MTKENQEVYTTKDLRHIMNNYLGSYTGLTLNDLNVLEQAKLLETYRSLIQNPQIYGNTNDSRILDLESEAVFRFFDSYFDVDLKDIMIGCEKPFSQEFRMLVKYRLRMWRDQSEIGC
ncbi:MAG TPA: hypothetical protein P5277_01540 [Candidatus Paceibacterota bacterium]|nr:hypothetical protein [Candidatus Paceibacterota bacterium]